MGKPKKNILLIGYGSIGKRYSRLLTNDFGCAVIVYDPGISARDLQGPGSFISEISPSVLGGVSCVFVCSPNHLHVEHAMMVLNQKVPVFIEKPIADSVAAAQVLLDVLQDDSVPNMVSCNFRFESGMALLKRHLEAERNGKPYRFIAEFGQFLPSWRPHLDYRKTYSAQKAMGGGVVLDRIHEFDYLRNLFGEFSSTEAVIGKISNLELDVEDIAQIMIEFKSGVSGFLHLDYLQPRYTCRLKVFTANGVYEWQFKPSFLKYTPYSEPNTEILYENPEPEIDQMYRDQIGYFLNRLEIDAKLPALNSIAEATDTLKVCDGVKVQAKATP